MPDIRAVGVVVVSIHAFRGEGDPQRAAAGGVGSGFNPRLPGGRRLNEPYAAAALLLVSIHAFRGGRRPPSASV